MAEERGSKKIDNGITVGLIARNRSTHSSRVSSHSRDPEEAAAVELLALDMEDQNSPVREQSDFNLMVAEGDPVLDEGLSPRTKCEAKLNDAGATLLSAAITASDRESAMTPTPCTASPRDGDLAPGIVY